MKKTSLSKTNLFLIIFLTMIFSLMQVSLGYSNLLQQEKKSTKGTTVEKKDASKSSQEVKKAEKEELICAVTGEEADPSLKMEYKGKTYYFCCKKCVKKFKENPEKYIK
ncbi:MAG: YHS domain-containing protein [Ignavibacteria bacterium]|nr:YHS domain-containing protein [Ignavibacteria bacterium]